MAVDPRHGEQERDVLIWEGNFSEELLWNNTLIKRVQPRQGAVFEDPIAVELDFVAWALGRIKPWEARVNEKYYEVQLQPQEKEHILRAARDRRQKAALKRGHHQIGTWYDFVGQWIDSKQKLRLVRGQLWRYQIADAQDCDWWRFDRFKYANTYRGH